MATRFIGDTATVASVIARLNALESDHSVTFARLPTPPAQPGFIGSTGTGNYQHVRFGAGFSLTGSGGVFTLKLPQAPAGNSLWGAGAAGDYERIQLGTNLSMSGSPGSLVLNASGGGAGVTDGDKGDIVVSGSGATWSIDSSVLSAWGRSLIGQSWASGTEIVAFTGASGAVTKLKVGASSATDLIDRQTGDARYALSGGGGSGTAPVATRTALAGVTGMSAGDMRYLSEAGREGWFKYSTANLSSQVSSDPGQGVYVPPAAATSGASGAWVRIWSDRLNAKWFGVTGDGTTNDLTAAQRALNFAHFVGGAEVFFPAGVYNLGSSGGIVFPSFNGGQWEAIKITGAGAVQEFGTALSFTMPVTGTVFISSATSGAAISVAAGSGTYAPFSGYCVYIEDLTVRTYNNPSCSGIDLTHALQYVVRNVQVDTGVYSNNVTAWSTTTSAGIITPANNNAALTELYNVAVSGYYKGIVMNEHANVVGGNVTGCMNALWYEFGNHSSWYQGKLQNNVQNFVINGACVFSASVNIEHASSGPQMTTADLKDVGSLAVAGEIVWSIVAGGIGQDTGFIRNGGNNVIDRRFGSSQTGYSYFYSGSSLPVSSGTDTYLSFPTTYVADGLQVRSADNTYIDVTKTGAYAFEVGVDFAANATGNRLIAILRTSSGITTVLGRGGAVAMSGTDTTPANAACQFVNLLAGDYIRVPVKQTSGGSLTIARDSTRNGVLRATRLGRTI